MGHRRQRNLSCIDGDVHLALLRQPRHITAVGVFLDFLKY